jgi:hypothetical protein
MHASTFYFRENINVKRVEPPPGEPWRLFPWFVLRQAGFPIEWLDELSSIMVSDAAGKLLDTYTELLERRRTIQQALRQAFLSESASPHMSNQSLSDIHRQVAKGRPIRTSIIHMLAQETIHADGVKHAIAWNASLQRLHTLYQTYAIAYAHEIERASMSIIDRYSNDQRLQNVLLLSNEASFDVFHEWLESRKNLLHFQSLKRDDRRKIDTLMLYLQRICAKNETHSHFGPFSPGQVVLEREGIQWHGEEPLKRVAFYTHWAASEIAQRMSQDPAVYKWIRPRRKPLVFLADGHLRLLSLHYDSSEENEVCRGLRLLPPQLLTEDESAVLQACNGERTLQDVFTWWQRSKPETTWETFWKLLEALERYGALIITFEVPIGSVDTLGDLQKVLPSADSISTWWMDTLNASKGLLHQFMSAEDVTVRRALFRELKSQFTELTGSSPSRGLGQAYADRSILYEECQRNLQGLSVGGFLAKVITDDLAIFYDLLLLVSRYRLTAERRMLNDWFVVRFSQGQQVPLEEFLEAFVSDATLLEERYRAIDTEEDIIRKAIDDVLLPPSSLHQRVVQVDPVSIQRLLIACHAPIPAVCNPDVMIIASSLEAIRRGEFQVLVADCHAAREILSHTSLSPFLEEVFPSFAKNMITLYRSLLEDGEEVVDVMRRHPEKTSAQLVLACPDLETEGRSPKPRQHVLALDDLSVHQTPTGLRLYASRWQKFIRLMTSGIGDMQMRRNPFMIFGFPRHHTGLPVQGIGLKHIPRIIVNRIVLQRELWRIPTEVFGDHLTLGHRRIDDGEEGAFLRTKKIQRELNLPRYGFAKIPGEPKPIYVDFDSPVIVRQLLRLAKQATGLIEFSEMLPGPGHFWPQDAQGHYTTELRFAVFSCPASSLETTFKDGAGDDSKC